MDPRKLIDSLCETFADSRLFKGRYVNDKAYIDNSRLHARACGLLARVGVQHEYLVDFGRKYRVDPVVGLGEKGKEVTNPEVDVSFVDSITDTPTVLLEYESGDAPIYKMIYKFNLIRSFAKHSPMVTVICLLITVTSAFNKSYRPNTEEKWRLWNEFYGKPKEEWLPETEEDRQRFAKDHIPKLATTVFNLTHNKQLSLLIGTFYPNQLELRLFRSTTDQYEKSASYESIR